ncbi:pyruvate kinase, putative [Theileria equi strain WA]|uniref:pyruvate kinase n=1 Tax=Theileria equi strain WA TaxID=1537102 RepID=L0ATP6_THEEQ|nr:pyruvate kinase, putative [Theileria equi strain WA]AFZ79017.1 pyruvate kinase, putative [Theileria equi strain WA]|eukprot:XP_004828683.1 pyruvate kinase, putative [Theileria equi strain WA]
MNISFLLSILWFQRFHCYNKAKTASKALRFPHKRLNPPGICAFRDYYGSSIAFMTRSTKQPERKYREENTNYKVRNVKNNIFAAKAPFDKEHAVSFFSSVLSASYKTFEPCETPEGHLMTFAKQVATLGPATSNKDSIKSVLDAGVDVFRLNFSHGTRMSKLRTAMTVRQLEIETSNGTESETDGFIVNHKSLLGDIQGPKLRIGRFMPNLDAPGKNLLNKDSEFVHLKSGDHFKFDVHDIAGNRSRVQFNYPDILKQIKIGDKILLDDGNIVMKVVANNPQEPSITTVVQNDCILSSRKGFSVPNVVLPVDFLGPKDVRDVIFCLAIGVDFLGVSFIQNKSDILFLINILNDFYGSKYFELLHNRLNEIDTTTIGSDIEDEEVEKILDNYYNESFLPKKNLFKTLVPKENRSKIGIIPKIEKQAALDDIHNILRLSDGLMVARGDLGIETELANLPIIQKRLVQLCRLVYHKPCIVATQMLETMRSSLTPTRAEVSDVANAIFDGADAVMLSAESATGYYPAETVRMQRRILFHTEQDPYFPTYQMIKEMLLGKDIIDNIKIKRPYLHEQVNDLLKIDLEHLDKWNIDNEDIHNSYKTINDIISRDKIDSIFIHSEDELDLVQWISSQRHLIPIFLLTSDSRLSRQSQLIWGVKSHFLPQDYDIDEVSQDLLKNLNNNMNTALLLDTKDNNLVSSKIIKI